MYYLTRHLGERNGSPRLYLDSVKLADSGFTPGSAFELHVDRPARRLSLRVCETGRRHVSSKAAPSGRIKAVLDITGEDLAHFLTREPVRVIVTPGQIVVLPLASVRQQWERIDRLLGKLQRDEPLTTASIAHGIGVASHAAHSGLNAAGIQTTCSVISEISEQYLEQSLAHNPSSAGCSMAIAAPIQEVFQDDWLMARLPFTEIAELGLPCSGASKAGKAKRGHAMMEAHPEVGALVVPALALLRRLQPAIVCMENVVDYQASASAQLLRSMLRDMGYDVQEVILNAADFGSLEARERWFLVATTNGLELDLTGLASADEKPLLKELLDDVPLDDERWRTYSYLKDKAERDAAAGKGFKLQELQPTATSVPVIRKLYWKGGSTDPRLSHPTDPALSRLFTANEHARIRNCPLSMIDGLSNSTAHEALGQSVSHNVVKTLFERIGLWLKKAKRPTSVRATDLGYSLSHATG